MIGAAPAFGKGEAAAGVQLCPLPVSTLADITRNKVAQNTLALGASLSMMGVGFNVLEGVFQAQFGRKGEAVVNENVSIARAGYEYATANFKPFARPLPMTDKIVHFGKGQTETMLTLAPGKHTLELVFADYEHMSFDPPLHSKTITITVE